MIACLALPDLQLKKQWDGLPPTTYTLDFDEGMTFYARGDMQGNISVRRIVKLREEDGDDMEVASLTGQGVPASLRFSPDARFLAVFAGTKLRLWEFAADRSFDMADVKSFSFGSQGRQLAIVHNDATTVSLHDVGSRKEVFRSQPGRDIAKVAFHPNLQMLALATDKQVLLYDLKEKQNIEQIPHPGAVCCLSWAHNGRVLATGCEDRQIRVFEVGIKAKSQGGTDAGQLKGVHLLSQIVGHGTQGMKVMLNRDGSIVASSNWADNLRLWDAHAGQPLLMPLAEAGLFRFAARDDLLLSGRSLCSATTANPAERRRSNNDMTSAILSWNKIARAFGCALNSARRSASTASARFFIRYSNSFRCDIHHEAHRHWLVHRTLGN